MSENTDPGGFVLETSERPALELDADGRAWWIVGERRVPVAAGGDGEGGGEGGNGGGGEGEGDPPGAGGEGGAGEGGEGGKPGAGEGESEADRKLRSENKSLRDRLRTLEREQEKARKAGQTEAERAAEEARENAERAQTLEADLRAERLSRAVERECKVLGLADPIAAERLMDDDGVDWSDDGRPDPKSVARALAKAAKDHPILGKVGPGDGGEGGRRDTRPAGDFNAVLRTASGKA